LESDSPLDLFTEIRLIHGFEDNIIKDGFKTFIANSVPVRCFGTLNIIKK